VAALAETGELDDTLIVFTADNGFMHGEHRIPTGKVVVYEPSIRVPLIVRGPGIRRGTRVGNLVANTDLAPTILDATDATPGRAMDGRSLLPLIDDSVLEWGRDMLLETGAYSAIRTYRYVYVEYRNGDKELYDLTRDPHQLQNLRGNDSYRGIFNALAGRLASLRACRALGCQARPRLSLRLRFERGRTEQGRRCTRGRVQATVRGRDLHFVTGVNFYADNRRVGRDGRSPFRRNISRRRIDADGATLRVLAQLEDGRVVTVDRQIRAC
jgi:hypothetical protein